MSTDDDEWTPADEPVDLQKNSPPTARLPIGGDAAASSAVSGEDLWPENDGEAPTPDPGTEPIAGGAPRPDRVPGKVAKSAPKSSRINRRWIGIGLVAALVVALLGLGGTELYLRKQVSNCLSQAFGALTGAPIDVSLSAQPVLWQAMRKTIPFVEVNSTKTEQDGRMHLRIDQITARGDQSTIGSIKGDGHVPFSQVTTAFREQAQTTQDPDSPARVGQLESIRSNGDGTFDVNSTVTAIIFPVPVTVTLRPSVQGGKARFEVVRASVVGLGIPPDFAQTIVNDTSQAMFGSMLQDLNLTKLEVRGDGVDFAVNGSDLTVDENLIRPRSDCSDVTTALG